MFFTVSLSQSATVEVRVNYSPSDGTAIADLDYFASSGTLVFAPGQKQLRIPVSFRNDSVPEADETFFMNLSRPFNASIARARGVATIVDDDTVGAMELIPPESSLAPGERVVLTLRWVHPVGWRSLDTVDLRLVDGDETVLWVRFDEAANTLALCTTNDECLPGETPGGSGELRAEAATLFLDESQVMGSGPTGPSVDLVYTIGVEPSLSGRELLVEAAAADDDGERQDFAQVGTLMVEGASASPESGGGGGGCTVAPAGGGGLWLSLLAVWLGLARRLVSAMRR
jgi:hypothetical protein